MVIPTHHYGIQCDIQGGLVGHGLIPTVYHTANSKHPIWSPVRVKSTYLCKPCELLTAICELRTTIQGCPPSSTTPLLTSTWTIYTCSFYKNTDILRGLFFQLLYCLSQYSSQIVIRLEIPYLVSGVYKHDLPHSLVISTFL